MLRYAFINNVAVQIDTSWRFNTSINSQTTFNCTVFNINNVFIKKGYDIKFYDGSTLVWSGIITSVETYEPVPHELYYNLQVTSYEYITNRIKITEVYESKTAGYIFADIITKYLANDGITIGTLQDGITFERVVFNCLSVYEVLNAICISNPGYNWCINFNKTLDFYQKETYKSSTIINDTFQHRDFRYYDSLDEYRNVQYFEGGLKQTILQTKYKPSPKPDGVSRDFTLKYGIALEPTIYVNSVAIPSADMGLLNFDTQAKWYWSYNSKTITQDTNETVLSTSDVLEVSYYGLTKVKMLYEDNTRIQQRQVIESNSSGRYESYFSDNKVESNLEAARYCKGLIEKYSDNQSITLTIDNDIGDIAINKLVLIDKPLYEIYDWYLVESIAIYYQDPEHISYDVKLLSGNSVGGWEDYFRSLIFTQNEINSTDVLIKFLNISEPTTHTGKYIIQITTPMYPDDSLYPSDDLYPNYTVAGVIVQRYPEIFLYPKNDLYPGDITGGIVLND